MERLVVPLLNLTFEWIWLGEHIMSIKPSTVRVFAYDLSPTNDLFQTFSKYTVPWSLHYNASRQPPVTMDNTVNVILVNKYDKFYDAIQAAKTAAGAYRARNFLVCSSLPDREVASRLNYVRNTGLVVVGVALKNESMYDISANLDSPHPELIRVPTVPWLDSDGRFNLKNCTWIFGKYATDSAVSIPHEIFELFYGYVRAGLKCSVTLTDLPGERLRRAFTNGKIDMMLHIEGILPYTVHDIFFTFTSQMAWCVPDVYVLADTTYLLWHEFSGTTWLFLAASFLAVWLSVWWLSRKSGLSLMEAFFSVLSLLASIGVKCPPGHARWVFGVWLVAVLVLGTLYQSVLHSMMAAPSLVPEIGNLDQLIKSQRPVLFFYDESSQLPAAFIYRFIPPVLHERLQEVDIDTADRFSTGQELSSAVYTSIYTCKHILKNMRPFYQPGANSWFGVARTHKNSPLAPQLLKLSLQADAFGLTEFWMKRANPKSRNFVSETPDLQPITVTLLLPAIFLWCLGMICAFVVCVMELGWNFCKKRKFFKG